jgi:hypothetical protein
MTWEAENIVDKLWTGRSALGLNDCHVEGRCDEREQTLCHSNSIRSRDMKDTSKAAHNSCHPEHSEMALYNQRCRHDCLKAPSH